jgi:hypothetical protein
MTELADGSTVRFVVPTLKGSKSQEIGANTFISDFSTNEMSSDFPNRSVKHFGRWGHLTRAACMEAEQDPRDCGFRILYVYVSEENGSEQLIVCFTLLPK